MRQSLQALVLLIFLGSAWGAQAFSESPDDLLVFLYSSGGSYSLDRQIDGKNKLVELSKSNKKPVYFSVYHDQSSDEPESAVIAEVARQLLQPQLEKLFNHAVDLRAVPQIKYWQGGTTVPFGFIRRAQYESGAVRESHEPRYNETPLFDFHNAKFVGVYGETVVSAKLADAHSALEANQQRDQLARQSLDRLAAQDSREKIFLVYMVDEIVADVEKQRCTLASYNQRTNTPESRIITALLTVRDAEILKSKGDAYLRWVLRHEFATINDLWRDSRCTLLIDFAKNARQVIDARNRDGQFVKWEEVDTRTTLATAYGFSSVGQYEAATKIGVNVAEFVNLERHGVSDFPTFRARAEEMIAAGYAKAAKYADVISYLDDKAEGLKKKMSAVDVRSERERRLSAEDRERKLAQSAKQHGFKSGTAYEFATQINATSEYQIDKLAEFGVTDQAIYKATGSEMAASGYNKSDDVNDLITYLADKREGNSKKITAVAVRTERERQMASQQSAREKAVQECLKSEGYFDTTNQVAKTAIRRKCN